MHGTGEVALLVVPALILGTIARIVPIAAADFPLNDGALFFAMSQDLRDAGFILPATTTYNFDGLPFAYPPLALYLHAAVTSLGFDPISVFRWFPLLVSIATIVLVYLIAQEVLGSWRLAGVAAIVFALLPRSYEWLITGGGLTRGMGMALALVAVWQGIRLISQPSRVRIFLTGALGGLTALTHPEATVFVAVSLIICLVSIGRSRRQLASIAVAAIIGVLVAAPWWLAVSLSHGPDILAAAAGSRTGQLIESIRRFVFGDFTGAAQLDIFLGVGFLGFLLQIGRGRYLLPVWSLMIVLSISAAGMTFLTVPWAMLVAITVMEMILPAATRLAPALRHARLVTAGGLLGAAVLSSLATGYNPFSPVHALSQDQRAAMAWVASNTPRDARVAVVTGVPWQIDATSEWFPVLAQRHSLATPQGYEWSGQFPARSLAHQLLQGVCASRLTACVEAWQDEFSADIDYVFVPKGQLGGLASAYDCCPGLRADLSARHQIVFDGPGATVVRFNP